METLEALARPIRLLVLDVDGVLTDGRLYYGPEGETLKAFHTLDGQGIKLLRRVGILTAVISGRDSPALRQRLADLSIDLFHLGREDKLVALESLWSACGLGPEATAFMGDDWPDLAPMAACRLSATVPNASPAVLAAAHWCATRSGGLGAVREFSEFVLAAQGQLTTLLAEWQEGRH